MVRVGLSKKKKNLLVRDRKGSCFGLPECVTTNMDANCPNVSLKTPLIKNNQFCCH